MPHTCRTSHPVQLEWQTFLQTHLPAVFLCIIFYLCMYGVSCHQESVQHITETVFIIQAAYSIFMLANFQDYLHRELLYLQSKPRQGGIGAAMDANTEMSECQFRRARWRTVMKWWGGAGGVASWKLFVPFFLTLPLLYLSYTSEMGEWAEKHDNFFKEMSMHSIWDMLCFMLMTVRLYSVYSTSDYYRYCLQIASMMFPICFRCSNLVHSDIAAVS